MSRRGLALAVAALMLTSGCRFSLQGLPRPGGISGPHYELEAVFSDVLNLPDGAQVRSGGIVVGQVRTIATKDFQAHVRMVIRSEVHLPAGTSAQVRFDSPLGDAFIQLTPPERPAPDLTPGSVIGPADTTTAPTIEDTFAALSVLLNGGGISQIKTIVTELNHALDGRQQDARHLLSTVDTTLATLAAHRDDINHALTALQSLTAQLSQGQATIAGALDAGAPALTALADQTSQLTQLLASLDRLGSTTSALLRTSGQTAVRDINDLAPVVHQLVALTGQIGPTLKVIDTFEHTMPRTAPGQYLQLKVLVLGLLGNAGTVPELQHRNDRPAWLNRLLAGPAS